MTRKVQSKKAFTLIEVMIAVMIVSIVIMALIQMYANNTHLFLSYKNQTKINQYSSFLIANKNYGYEDKTITMYDLVRDFKLHDDLRRELKDIKIEVAYIELDRIDLGESEIGEYENIESETTQAPDMILEIGKTILRTDDSSSSLLRFKL